MAGLISMRTETGIRFKTQEWSGSRQTQARTLILMHSDRGPFIQEWGIRGCLATAGVGRRFTAVDGAISKVSAGDGSRVPALGWAPVSIIGVRRRATGRR